MIANPINDPEKATETALLSLEVEEVEEAEEGRTDVEGTVELEAIVELDDPSSPVVPNGKPLRSPSWPAWHTSCFQLWPSLVGFDIPVESTIQLKQESKSLQSFDLQIHSIYCC